MRKIIKANKNHIEIITQYNILMAQETENKKLEYQTVRKGVESVLNNPDKGTYYLCTEESEIIGQLMITKEWSDWRNCYFYWIQSVYTNPSKRGTGVFKELFNHILKIARLEKGCGVRLYVDKNNLIARKAYKKLKMQDSDYLLYELEF